MRIAGKFAILLISLCGALRAQPVIASDGIVNAASYTPSGFSNSGIAQGSIFAIFGTGLGPAASPALSFPLASTLGGVSIKITIGSTTINAIPLFVSPNQINALLLSKTPEGDGALTVTFNGQTSASAPIHVVKNSFGSFTINQAGNGPIVVTDANYVANVLTGAFAPGQTVILWGTGLGAVSGDDTAGPLPGDQTGITVEVFVGGKPASIVYRGRSGCCAGVDQIAFVIPAGIEGCHVPVVVRVNGVVSNFATMSISSTGKLCSDPHWFSTADLQKVAEGSGTLTVGGILLSRSTSIMAAPPPIGSVNSTTDFGSAAFARYEYARLIASTEIGFSGYAPFGSCNVSVYRTGGSGNVALPAYLDAGPVLNVKGPNGTKQLTKGTTGAFAGFYSGQLGGGGFPGSPPLFLDKGSYTVDNGAGGADVGAFRATLNIPDPLVWTNQSSISNIPRSQDLRVTWTGGDPSSFVVIFGSSASTSPKVGGSFLCTERVSAGQFTIPSIVLSALPASSQSQGLPSGFLSLGTSPLFQNGRFQAPGLDVGYLIYTNSTNKSVNYQ
jgi:uncharacterized protein (TIGR03437 family)